MNNQTSTPTNGDQTETATTKRQGRPPGTTRRSKSGHRIELPDGDALVPRDDLAAELRISPRSLARMKAPTVLHGGIAYCRDRATRQMLADASMPNRRGRR
jgi:hypothetical protein